MYFIINIISKVWLIGWVFFAFLGTFFGKDFSTSMAIVIIGTIVSLFLRSIRRSLKLLKTVRGVIKNPTNKNVKAYIGILEKLRGFSGKPSEWELLVESYRRASKSDNVDYDLKVQLFDALKLLGTKGVYPPKKSKNISNKEREENIRQAGQEGERQVEYALEWLDNNRFKVFSDIRLPYNGKSQQFDTVIVGENGVFNIETKNFVGDLTIDEEGNWYRTKGNTKTGTENVNFQIRRHNKVLSNVLEDKLPIIDLIVWTNVESIIEGVEYSTTKIIKVDQLVEFIEDYNEGENLSEQEINFATRSIEGKLKS